MEIRQLRAFVAIAETGTFTAGAARVHVTQAAISMQIRQLEIELRGVQTELLSEDSLVAIASPRHQLAKQKVVSAYALAGEKLILGERGGNTRRLIDQFFAQAGVKLKVAMELSRLAAIKRMVEADMGVGIVPLQSVLEEVGNATLVRWWIEGAQINWQLGIARLVGGYESPIHQKFLV